MQLTTAPRPISTVKPAALAQRLQPGTEPQVIKLIATDSDAICPQRANDTDMGVDLAIPTSDYLSIDNTLAKGGLPHKTDFGLVLHPDSYDQVSGLMLCLRSSMANSGLLLANGVGLIDADYPGHLAKDESMVYGICALLHNLGATKDFLGGTRIAQLVVYNASGRLIRPEFKIVSYMTEADDFKRFLGERKATRRGGFGSTGR